MMGLHYPMVYAVSTKLREREDHLIFQYRLLVVQRARLSLCQ